MIGELLDKRKDLQDHLFVRGFLITNGQIKKEKEFPFYGNWNRKKINNFEFWTHKFQKKYFFENENRVFFLLGHAYNPFTMEVDDLAILERIAKSYKSGKIQYFDAIDELTGVFVLGYISGKVINFLVDPAGMQSACYGVIDEKFYLSSHAQLVGDICSLKMDDFIKELIQYKWYKRVMGPYLPADLTPFTQVKRIVPNIYYGFKNKKISHGRFYPRGNCKTKELHTLEEYNEIIKKGADILKNNLALIPLKWKNPQISLTGGIDSNTTFAAAIGNYQNYEVFSYLSAPKERIDVEAAEKIASVFNIKHKVYYIPETKEMLKDYEEKEKILTHNTGYIAMRKDNETRKRIYLQEHCTADVEVKSWVSETIRGYWYKHYRRKKMPELSPKLYRNLYKIFLGNRVLAKKIDGIFEEYIVKFEYKKIPKMYLPADMHYNEVTWGSWGGLNVSEMQFCFDLTFPYNNRKFLDLMLKIPLEKRISDQHHLDMKKYLNERLCDLNISVSNMKETKFRATMLNVIFTINSWLPF